MATSAEREICETCGATLRAESPAGLCPACLLTTAIEEGDLEESISGSRVQDYELLNEVARGGMGIVYRARQRAPVRIVALKMILPAHVGSADAMKRFCAETEAAASLEHEGILPIYAVGEHDGAPFYSMKFAEGGALSDRLGQYRDKPRDAAVLVAALARAVAYAHERGILHRDLKPANVLFDGAAKPYVSDFGLAKWLARESNLTQTLAMLGTPFYMAPEQAVSSNTVTASADVYSLGAILYHLLTGDPPFTGDAPMEVLRRAADQPAPRPRLRNRSIPADLETICLKCLEKEPAWRYPSAAALADDLDRFCAGRAIQARRAGLLTRSGKWVRRKPTGALLLASLVALAAVVGWNIWRSELVHHPMTTGVAVLPFENLSEQKENSAFADGVQDDILTKLAKIHDLKVISRTSVMQYRGKRNVRQIGNELRVSHVLEGSVRKTGNLLHLNAQLIDARTDTHIWAEQYDVDPAEIFAIQSEIARRIAIALNAKLGPEEKAHLVTRPTNNADAYMLYLTGLGTEDNIAAEKLFMQAIALDPGFALAYAHASLRNTGTSSSLPGEKLLKARARAQAEEALRLAPTSGEAHEALGLCLYWGEKNYDAALKEFKIAAAASPNDANIYGYMAGIYRRQGRWRESIATFQRAVSLDPRNSMIAFHAGNNYLFLRDWSAAAASFNRALEIAPESVVSRIGLAYLELFRNGNPAAGRKILQNIPAGNDPYGHASSARWDLAMLQNDYAAAEVVIPSPRQDSSPTDDFPSAFYQGRVSLARGETEAAVRYFAAAALIADGRVRDAPEVAGHHSRLGLIYAYMQRKDDAIRESRRAIELEPESQNAFHGALYASNLALVYALVGEPDKAITLIERLLTIPGALGWPNGCSITLAELRLRPEWDSLRNNPRFQKILAAPEPKTIY